jgi:hypothetical protein
VADYQARYQRICFKLAGLRTSGRISFTLPPSRLNGFPNRFLQIFERLPSFEPYQQESFGWLIGYSQHLG